MLQPAGAAALTSQSVSVGDVTLDEGAVVASELGVQFGLADVATALVDVHHGDLEEEKEQKEQLSLRFLLLQDSTF